MADDIRKAFTFNPRLSNKKTKEMSEQIDHDENAVSIHVRRGDYLEPKYWKTTGCVCQLPYYLNAIAENEQTDKPALLLCFLGRHCLGERKPAVAKSFLHRLEQRYRKLAGYDADEPLPSPHYL